jgi:hypothetical protein
MGLLGDEIDKQLIFNKNAGISLMPMFFGESTCVSPELMAKMQGIDVENGETNRVSTKAWLCVKALNGLAALVAAFFLKHQLSLSLNMQALNAMAFTCNHVSRTIKTPEYE